MEKHTEHDRQHHGSKSNQQLMTGIVIGAVSMAIVFGVAYGAKKVLSRQPVTQQAMQGAGKGEGATKGGAGGGIMQPITPPPMTDVQTTELKNGTSTATTQKTFHVAGGNFFFVPTEMKVNKGDTVTVVFDDVGGFHDFIIDELNVKTKRIQTNGQDTITFTADKAGSFEYYCSVGTHRQLGMKGTLIVQ